MKRPFLSACLVLLLTLSACNQAHNLPATLAPLALTSQSTETPMLPTTQPEPTSTPTSFTLNRGVNMGNMLESPNEGDWGTLVQEEYFDLIKQAGFDFVRVPIRWSAHAQQGSPYTIDPIFLSRVGEVINWALKRDLTVIVDFHHYEEMMSNPSGNKDRYLGIWKQVAEHYKDYPSSVIFELLNEPNGQLDASLWNQYLTEALAIIRETGPTRDVVIGPANWNAYDWVSTLDVPNDEHLIVTFHYYLPFQFTHQGAEWVDGSKAWMGTTWDATPEQKAEITSNFDSVADWAKQHGNVHILLGEFGAYSKAPQDSRVRWTTFVREQAEAHGFAWSYWEFNSGFGMYDPNAKVWREDLLRALIP